MKKVRCTAGRCLRISQINTLAILVVYIVGMIFAGGFKSFSQTEGPIDPETLDPRLAYSDACFRESKDQPWSLNIRGNVSSPNGCFIVIHTADRVIGTFLVPRGNYTQQPLVLSIPVDGITGDYRMLIIGSTEDVMGINLPLTTLKQEVYGYKGFVHDGQKPLWFLPPDDATEFEFIGLGGSLRVLDASGNSLGESGKIPDSRNTSLKITLAPGKRYGFQPIDITYTDVKPGAYASFDPERLFLPDPRLQQFPWWLDPRLAGSDSSRTDSNRPESVETPQAVSTEGKTETSPAD